MLMFSLLCLSAAVAAFSVMSGAIGPVGGVGHEIAAVAFLFSALLTTLGFVAADG